MTGSGAAAGHHNNGLPMKNEVPPSALHRRLRQATKSSHHVLDHHPVLAPLVRPDLSVDQYSNALDALHGIHTDTEAAILTFLDQHPGLFDYRARRKLPALEADLAVLGRTPVLLAAHVPVPQSVAELVGILYTIEGASQGGQVIARVLREGPLANVPTAFFRGYGPLSRQRWDEFLEFADAQCSGDEQEVAAASAVSTFEAIRCYLDAYCDHFGIQ